MAVKQKAGRGLCLSDSVRLERTWHERHRKIPQAKINAKFNANTMDGIQVFTSLSKDDYILQSTVLTASLYRVAISGWALTQIGTLTFTEGADGIHSVSVPQSSFGSNELTGMETYMIEVKLMRVRRHYGAKVWFNHLGCFDSLNELRKTTERLEIMKVDE